MSNISTIKFSSPLGWSFLSTPRASVRFILLISLWLKLRRKDMSMIKHIGPPVTRNSLRMSFVLQLGIPSLHPWGIEWRINIRTVTPFLVNNGVTSCTPWRWKITEREIRLKSKKLRLLRQLRPPLISIQFLEFPTRRRLLLVYYQTSIIRVRRSQGINIISVTVCCARSL